MVDIDYHAWPLATWLDYIERQHPVAWDLGLARVGTVADRLNVRAPAPLVLTVAGTNGKGSTTTAIEHFLIALGLKTGATFSPHLFEFNERIRLDGKEVDDEAICAAFVAIESVRGETSLTYFEYAMLAAFWSFKRAKVDAAVIEVGLGGRLDASNIADADVAVVTSVDLDHQDYLGPDRETIGAEKVAIARVGRPVILGERHPPQSVLDGAATLGAQLVRRDHDFAIRETPAGFHFTCGDYGIECGVKPRLALDNVAAALAAVVACGFAPNRLQVEQAMSQAWIQGRMQTIDAKVPVIVDVAHNPHGAAFFAASLAARDSNRASTVARRSHCVLGTLADKDAPGIISALKNVVDRWYCVSTVGARGFPGDRLQALIVHQCPDQSVATFATVADALQIVLAEAVEGDRVLVCGCFQVAGHALQALGAAQ